MNRFLFGVARAVTETFTLPEPIVEIGAFQVAGQPEELSLRRLFPGRDYTGLDLRWGPGVDRVADVERLPQPAGSVGTLIAMNTFEHVRRFWQGFAEVRRVLRPDGVFLLSCPFFFHIHDHPHDYWRFTPAASKRCWRNIRAGSSAGTAPNSGPPMSGRSRLVQAGRRSRPSSSPAIAPWYRNMPISPKTP